MTPAPGPDYDIQLLAPIDFRAWHCAHELGQVSDRLPYGFDQLQGPRIALRSTPIGSPRKSVRGLVTSRPTAVAGPDWAVTWDERSAVAAMQAGVRAKWRASGLIWATDHVERGDRTLEMKLLRRYLRRLDVVWCLSRTQVDLAKKWLQADQLVAPRVDFLRFGLNTEHFGYAEYPTQKMVLSIGNDPDRDAPATIAAMIEIQRVDPEVRLVIQSRGIDHAPPGIELVRSLPHERLLEMYRRASVVLIATCDNSHVSGMTVALEAQSIGRPVVMTKTRGAEDYLWSENEALVDPGDVAGLATQTLALLRDRERAADIGRRSRWYTEKLHTTTLMMRGLAELLSLPLGVSAAG
jgi:glycosyltransferase involved in cell wall biosynthesis